MPFGVTMVGPVIIAFGSEEQKNFYLPRILTSEDWWCQGYSEPGSGSDLASLKTKAIRDGDDYIVNGSKTWTSFAQFADMIFCLVRTSTEGKKQSGISFLLIDMNSPGIDVRPIKTMDGGVEINQVFFDNVRVPFKNLVGKENHGWDYAKYLLGHERTGTADIGQSRNQITRVRQIAREELVDGKPLLDDPTFQRHWKWVGMKNQLVLITRLRLLRGILTLEKLQFTVVVARYKKILLLKPYLVFDLITNNPRKTYRWIFCSMKHKHY
jgi:alkylation response protein AidB-like acyl-CoA dehydrogenase